MSELIDDIIRCDIRRVSVNKNNKQHGEQRVSLMKNVNAKLEMKKIKINERKTICFSLATGKYEILC